MRNDEGVLSRVSSRAANQSGDAVFVGMRFGVLQEPTASHLRCKVQPCERTLGLRWMMPSQSKSP